MVIEARPVKCRALFITHHPSLLTVFPLFTIYDSPFTILPELKMPRLILAAFLFVCGAYCLCWSADVTSAFLFRNSAIRNSNLPAASCGLSALISDF